MSVSQSTSVATILREHVTLEVESIDRMYLNVYVPLLQSAAGVAHFFRAHRGATFASSALMDPISAAFVAALERFAHTQSVPLLTFAKGRRKDEVAAEHLARFTEEEGVLFIGKAQEKTAVVRTEKRRNLDTGQSYPWLVRATAMVNHYYIYGVDRDFGPFFLKVCSYFPYNAKLCLNGHELCWPITTSVQAWRTAQYRRSVLSQCKGLLTDRRQDTARYWTGSRSSLCSALVPEQATKLLLLLPKAAV